MKTLPPLAYVALAAVLLSTAAPPALAQWKWRDKTGQITASDLPPPRDVAERDILQRPEPARRAPPPAPAAASAAAAVVAKPAVDKDLETRRRAAEAEQQSKQREADERLAQQRAENCRRARGHLAALDSGQRIARTNERGEREILDDKGRAEETRRAQDVIASDCR